MLQNPLDIVILIRHINLETTESKILEEIWRVNSFAIHYHVVFQSDKVQVNQKLQTKLECQIRIIQGISLLSHYILKI